MTEAGWLACDEPLRMLGWLVGDPRERGGGPSLYPQPTSRKLLLFAVACWELMDTPDQAEMYSYMRKHEAFLPGTVAGAAEECAYEWCRRWTGEVCTARAKAGLLRDVFGNPWRQSPCGWQVLRSAADMSARALESGASEEQVWRGDWLITEDVLRVSRAIYDDRRFDCLPGLADALEEAGCTDENILAHCRGAAGHVRGCWVVDLLLGKS